MKLETERLLLRDMQVADVPALTGLWTDPEVTRFMGGPRDYQELNTELLKDARDESPPQFDLWVLIEKATSRVIGHCGIIDKEIDGITEYDLTYVLVKSAWGKGYATEIAISIKDYAFKNLGLKRIVALIDPLNLDSQHVAKKVGLRHEKDVVRPHGKVMQVYSLTYDG